VDRWLAGPVPAISAEIGGQTVYASTGNRIYRSTDAGDSWTSAGVGLPDKPIQAIAIDPVSPSVVYAATAAGLFRTIDGGLSWKPTSAGGGTASVAAIAVSRTVPPIVYAATTAGVLKSVDSGQTWKTTLALSASAVAIDPELPANVYAAFPNMIYRTADGGENWTPASFRFSAPIAAGAGGRLYASTAGFSGGIWTSPDRGATWTQAAFAFGVTSIAVNPLNPLTLYASVSDPLFLSRGVRKSLDGGLSWSYGGLGERLVLSLAFGEKDDATVFAGTNDREGVFRLREGESNWLPLTPHFANLPAAAVAIASDSTVHVGTELGVFLKRPGLDWERATPLGGPVDAVAIDPNSPGRIYAIAEAVPGPRFTVHSGLFQSIDGGVTWSLVLSSPVRSVAFDPTVPSMVYAGGGHAPALFSGGGVFKTSDGGTKWVASNDGLCSDGGNPLSCKDIFSLAVDPQSPSTVYAGDAGTIYKTSDAGAHWSPVEDGLNGFVASLAIDPFSSSTVYAGGPSAGLLKTIDGGTNWIVVVGLSGRQIFSVVVEPLSRTVFAATDSGVFRSDDDGETWNEFNDGLTGFPVSAVAIGPNHTLYAATQDGVFAVSILTRGEEKRPPARVVTARQ
jgi:photosystem II stability/assembly factor-like uncharacterized protein